MEVYLFIYLIFKNIFNENFKLIEAIIIYRGDGEKNNNNI